MNIILRTSERLLLSLSAQEQVVIANALHEVDPENRQARARLGV